MLRDWPIILLPLPTLDAFDESASPSGVRSQMEGKKNQRLRHHGQTLAQKVQWSLSDAQWNVFQGFLFYSLHGGNDWFNVELPGDDGLLTMSVARFVGGQYETKQQGERWIVTATLEVRQEEPVDA